MSSWRRSPAKSIRFRYIPLITCWNHDFSRSYLCRVLNSTSFGVSELCPTQAVCTPLPSDSSDVAQSLHWSTKLFAYAVRTKEEAGCLNYRNFLISRAGGTVLPPNDDIKWYSKLKLQPPREETPTIVFVLPQQVLLEYWYGQPVQTTAKLFSRASATLTTDSCTLT